MGRNRFVIPETVRLELSDGDWIEVKKRLTYAEQQQLEAAGLGGLKTTTGKDVGEIAIDWERYKMARFVVWIVDWSLRDINDKPVRFSISAIAALELDTVLEIENAISKHVEAMEEEKKVEKAAAAMK